MTRVLVTGGAGYIGSHTAKVLAQNGYEPVVIDNLSEGHRWAARYGPFVEGDVADKQLVLETLRAHEVKAVIHFAASAYVGESMVNPRKYFSNNAAAALALLEAVLDAGVGRVVFSSTCATYGIPREVPIPDDHGQLPENPYGEAKLFVERVLKWYGQAYGLRSVALRYFNAAGADPDGELGEDHDPETHLIPLALLAALGKVPQLKVFGTDYPTPDGSAVRDYVHVMDLADAHVRALELLEQRERRALAMNLGTGHGHSVLEVLETVEGVTGKSVPHELGDRRPGDPPELVANPSRAKQLLGWTPRYSELATIIETAWRWHQHQS